MTSPNRPLRAMAFAIPLAVVLLFHASPAAAQTDSVLQRWIDQDVAYIVDPPERQAFEALTTEAERERFIESFWLRRDPTPLTLENEFREEHYRRIATANQQFASSGSATLGWQTDRGRMLVVYGEPDQRVVRATGGVYERPSAEGGGVTLTFPFEQWRYAYIQGIGEQIMFEFVDTDLDGTYRLADSPSEKYASN